MLSGGAGGDVKGLANFTSADRQEVGGKRAR